MGLFDSLGNMMGKKPTTPSNPSIHIVHSLLPMRLKAHSSERTTLSLSLKFMGTGQSMCSVAVFLQQGLSFDTTNINRKKEVRLGMLNSSSEKKLDMDIMSSSSTAPGDYQIKVIAYVHDNNYNQVVRSFEKSVNLRVV